MRNGRFFAVFKDRKKVFYGNGCEVARFLHYARSALRSAELRSGEGKSFSLAGYRIVPDAPPDIRRVPDEVDLETMAAIERWDALTERLREQFGVPRYREEDG